ncbi:hypothetical protein GGF46_004280 [Coemansia sp. RSA 552]|nr:hypothetical protein GGF46_004280 [Coemansia sp. RSA 552]
MKGLNVLSYLTVGIVGLLAGNAAAGQHTFAKRLETTSVNGMKGAVLLKNGQPTTCELALVSNKLAFVAANCLAFQPNSNILDTSATYQVMVSDGGTGSAGTYKVVSTESHPKYNPISFANNVAIVRLDDSTVTADSTGNSTEWRNYIAANPADWTSQFYVRRALAGSNWAMPEVVEGATSPPSECSAASPLYAANTKDMLCSSAMSQGGGCATPYGTVYGVHDPDLAVSALYSHSVIVGESLCKSTAVYNYYTILSNYLEWGGAVAGSTIYLYTADMNYVNNNDPNYKMQDLTQEATVGNLIIGGDLNTAEAKPMGQEPSSSEAESSSATQMTGMMGMPTAPITDIPAPSGSAESEGANEEEPEKKSNLTLILLIVGGILLLLALLAYFLYRRFKKRKAPENNMTQYNQGAGMGFQDYTPEYDDNYNPHRQHLDNAIITEDRRPESYEEERGPDHKVNPDAKDKRDFMD